MQKTPNVTTCCREPASPAVRGPEVRSTAKPSSPTPLQIMLGIESSNRMMRSMINATCENPTCENATCDNATMRKRQTNQVPLVPKLEWTCFVEERHRSIAYIDPKTDKIDNFKAFHPPCQQPRLFFHFLPLAVLCLMATRLAIFSLLYVGFARMIVCV